MDRRASVDIQARSRDEALRLALEQLGAKAEDVTVEVLAEIENDFYGDGEVLLRVTRKGSGGRPQPVPQESSPAARQSVGDDVLEEYEQLVKDIVVDLLDRMAVEADVVAVDNPSVMPVGADDPPTVFIDIMGRDLGLLIGRRGENLSQFQYLVNLLLNRQTDDWVRAIIDVEGYRIRREESLIGLAERVGRQVVRNRRPISLEPMPPNERRVVHLTLQNQPDVSTESSGEEPMRRVTIVPN
ncbi:MAG: RNA-binding cell elongation regulator Jag/EloR [Thermomicrobiales bacterium]